MSMPYSKKPDKPTKTHKKRTCLRCNKSFDSTGPDNRICPTCAVSNRNKGKKPIVKEFKFR